MGHFNSYVSWLVVDLPLRKIWVRQLGLLLIITPNTWKIIHDVPKKEMIQMFPKVRSPIITPTKQYYECVEIIQKRDDQSGTMGWSDRGFAGIRYNSKSAFFAVATLQCMRFMVCNLWDLDSDGLFMTLMTLEKEILGMIYPPVNYCNITMENHGKSPLFMAKSTIKITIFNSKQVVITRGYSTTATTGTCMACCRAWKKTLR